MHCTEPSTAMQANALQIDPLADPGPLDHTLCWINAVVMAQSILDAIDEHCDIFASTLESEAHLTHCVTESTARKESCQVVHLLW